MKKRKVLKHTPEYYQKKHDIIKIILRILDEDRRINRSYLCTICNISYQTLATLLSEHRSGQIENTRITLEDADKLLSVITKWVDLLDHYEVWFKREFKYD